MRSPIIGRGEPADPEEVGDFGLCENCYDGQQARRRLGSKSTEDSIKPGYGLPISFHGRVAIQAQASRRCAYFRILLTIQRPLAISSYLIRIAHLPAG